MRKDYQYVDDATSICLTTTEEGDNQVVGVLINDEHLDLLVSVQSEYFTVKGTITEWYEQYKEQYEEQVGVSTPTSLEAFKECLMNDWMTVHKVIWD